MAVPSCQVFAGLLCKLRKSEENRQTGKKDAQLNHTVPTHNSPPKIALFGIFAKIAMAEPELRR